MTYACVRRVTLITNATNNATNFRILLTTFFCQIDEVLVLFEGRFDNLFIKDAQEYLLKARAPLS